MKLTGKRDHKTPIGFSYSKQLINDYVIDENDCNTESSIHTMDKFNS